MFGIGIFFRFLLSPSHPAVGRGGKTTRDMLGSLHWDEESLFNLMFVRMSIISFLGKTCQISKKDHKISKSGEIEGFEAGSFVI